MIEEILPSKSVPRCCSLKTRSRAAGPPEFRVVHPAKEGSRFDCPVFPVERRRTIHKNKTPQIAGLAVQRTRRRGSGGTESHPSARRRCGGKEPAAA